MKKRKPEDSDYEEREVCIVNYLLLHFGVGVLLMSDLTRPGQETKEEDQRGNERREEESQKRAGGEVEMVRHN